MTTATPADLTTATPADGTTVRTEPPLTTPSSVQPGPTRAGLLALVIGAALNTAQAVLLRAFSSGDSPAARLADGDAHPVAVPAMVLLGLAGVVLLVVGLQHAARVVRPHARRTAQAGAALAFVGGHSEIDKAILTSRWTSADATKVSSASTSALGPWPAAMPVRRSRISHSASASSGRSNTAG